MTVATNALYTPGAIGNVTKRTGDIGQGLEPDEGQLSRPVLRGLVSGNTHRLSGHRSSRTFCGLSDSIREILAVKELRFISQRVLRCQKTWVK